MLACIYIYILISNASCMYIYVYIYIYIQQIVQDALSLPIFLVGLLSHTVSDNRWSVREPGKCTVFNMSENAFLLHVASNEMHASPFKLKSPNQPVTTHLTHIHR